MDIVECEGTEQIPGCEGGHVHVASVGRDEEWEVVLGLRQGPRGLPHAAFLRISPAATARPPCLLTERVVRRIDWQRVFALGFAYHLLGADAALHLDQTWCVRPTDGSDNFSRLVADLHQASAASRLPARQLLSRILQRSLFRVDDLIREARDRGMLPPHDPHLSYRPQPPPSHLGPIRSPLPPEVPPTWQMDACTGGAVLRDLPNCRDFDFHVGVCFLRTTQEQGVWASYLRGPTSKKEAGTGAYPQSLEVQPAMWHAGGVTAELTVKRLEKLPLLLVLALGPEVQLGDPTSLAHVLAGNHPPRGSAHLQAVATVHRFALQQGLKPHDMVAQTWRVPLRTAQEWSRKARRSGLLYERSVELARLRPPVDSEKLASLRSKMVSAEREARSGDRGRSQV
ncbi:hypothetical protein ACF08M_36135 [Streptomyces sp. NPDC015032]|uniref:hypothetical protein n=1 Tax=Streptomyces sp. NPDC015032 TaxID=3364937 RepID=UPI0036FD5622